MVESGEVLGVESEVERGNVMTKRQQGGDAFSGLVGIMRVIHCLFDSSIMEWPLFPPRVPHESWFPVCLGGGC